MIRNFHKTVTDVNNNIYHVDLRKKSIAWFAHDLGNVRYIQCPTSIYYVQSSFTKGLAEGPLKLKAR